MSATIILIMTSSSTRNTEPRGGRVAVMNFQSLPNPACKFANNPRRCNAKGNRMAGQTPGTHNLPACRLIGLPLGDKLSRQFRLGNECTRESVRKVVGIKL